MAPDASPPAAAVASRDAGVSGQPGVVAVNRTPVKQTPDEKGKTVTHLFRGERVAVLERGNPYCRIQLSDGEVGWAPVKNLLLGQSTEAALVNDQDLYVRPDALSPVRRRAAAGTLLFVLQDKDGWRQVQLADRFQGWVPKDRAVTEGPELEGARALWKAELLVEQKRPEVAAATLREFMTTYPSAKLATLVETKLGALPAESGPDASVPADGGAATPADAGRAVAVMDAAVPPAASAGAVAAPAAAASAALVVPAAAAAASSGPRPMTVMP